MSSTYTPPTRPSASSSGLDRMNALRDSLASGSTPAPSFPAEYQNMIRQQGLQHLFVGMSQQQVNGVLRGIEDVMHERRMNPGSITTAQAEQRIADLFAQHDVTPSRSELTRLRSVVSTVLTNRDAHRTSHYAEGDATMHLASTHERPMGPDSAAARWEGGPSVTGTFNAVAAAPEAPNHSPAPAPALA